MLIKGKTKEKTKKGRVVFSLEAPEAKEAFLVGDFNDWNTKKHPMKRDKRGDWEKIVMLPPGTYEYKFLVDGEWWNDPRNQAFSQNCFGTQNNVMTISPK